MSKFLSKNNRYFLFSTLIVFALIYSSISIVNHYLYRTYALDLGVYNHALYAFANFKPAIFTLGIDGKEMPFLGTHFSPIMFFYIPFYYLFGSYALLVIQILAILSGGIAIYKYSTEKFRENPLLPKLILVQFFSIWGIYSALSFDFHNNVIAAMLVIWFIYCLEKRKYLIGLLFWLLILFCQENMALWIIFILIGLIIKDFKEPNKYRLYKLGLLVLTIIYAVVVIGFVMPAYQGSESNLQLIRYSHLGNNFGEILSTIIQKPFYTLSLFFKNIIDNPDYNGIKMELHFMVLVSGGICLFLRPAYLIMLIPIYLQKLFSNDYYFWGINLQYSIEFVPIISFAFIDFLSQVNKYKKQIAIVIMLSTIIFNVDSINHRKSKWYNKTNTMFYGKRHYVSELNITEINQALNFIDDTSSVSASSCLAPRLAFREKIYHFPIVKDAEYIVLLTDHCSTYPITEREFNQLIDEYLNSKKYIVIYDKNDLLIFKRKE